MAKLRPENKTTRKPHIMGSSSSSGGQLSKPEMDAALQLIQLSGDSSSSVSMEGSNNYKVDGRGSGGNNNSNKNVNNGCSFEAESVAVDHEISSDMESNMILEDDNLDDEACPPRKFRSIIDIYLTTTPLIERQAAGGGKKRKSGLSY